MKPKTAAVYGEEVKKLAAFAGHTSAPLCSDITVKFGTRGAVVCSKEVAEQFDQAERVVPQPLSKPAWVNIHSKHIEEGTLIHTD